MGSKPTEFERLRDLISDHMGILPRKIKMDSAFIDDLGMDSLDMVELVMACEEEFNIEIPDAEAEQLLNVSMAVAYIDRKQSIEP